MRNRKYRIDGRDPNAKGYVNENRMANQHETDKIVEALESFGYKNVEDYKFHLFGRLDDVHGWYLFGISKEDDERENFLILGDCLDVLEGPTYNKVVGLDEVMHFARTAGSGDNVGTAYDAMQTWGVFNSLSQGFCDMMGSIDVCIENERAHWDDKRKEWKLSYDVMFYTDMGGDEKVTITIPAQLDICDDADREFMSEWKNLCAISDRETLIASYEDADATTAEVESWAESKERALYKIRRAITNYLEEGITPDEDDALAESMESVEVKKVWVLTIYKEAQFFPEVHRTLDGAVKGVIADIAEHMEEDEVDDYDLAKIRKELESHHYWHDDIKDVVYDIAECGVFA